MRTVLSTVAGKAVVPMVPMVPMVPVIPVVTVPTAPPQEDNFEQVSWIDFEVELIAGRFFNHI